MKRGAKLKNFPGKCIFCLKNQKEKNGIYFRKDCTTCIKKRLNKKKYRKKFQNSYSKHKIASCELCGFIPKLPCQLDVDHIDENNKNNSPKNLWTLCSNCHRAKSFFARWGEEGELEAFYESFKQ
jgi:5-methylcytosine-specific restriction endonuclease McrA